MKAAWRLRLAVNLGLVLLAVILPIAFLLQPLQSDPPAEVRTLRTTLAVVSLAVLVGAALNLHSIWVFNRGKAGESVTSTSVVRGSDVTLHNFTPRAQQVLALANREARRLRHSFVGTEHVLLGIANLGQGVASQVLQRLKIDVETLRHELEKLAGIGSGTATGTLPYAPRVRKILKFAAQEAQTLHHTYVGTEHLLLGLLREGDGAAARLLTGLGVNLAQTRQAILAELNPDQPT